MQGGLDAAFRGGRRKLFEHPITDIKSSYERLSLRWPNFGAEWSSKGKKSVDEGLREASSVLESPICAISAAGQPRRCKLNDTSLLGSGEAPVRAHEVFVVFENRIQPHFVTNAKSSSVLSSRRLLR